MIAPPPSGWWRVVAITSEWDDAARAWIPVVRHEMYGPTRERAIEVYQAHMRSDVFLRDCSLRERFGAVVCHTETELEIIA